MHEDLTDFHSLSKEVFCVAHRYRDMIDRLQSIPVSSFSISSPEKQLFYALGASILFVLANGNV